MSAKNRNYVAIAAHSQIPHIRPTIRPFFLNRSFPYAFYPQVSDKENNIPPHVVIAGDGDYSAWIMTRTDELTYDRDLISDGKGTIGALA